MTGFINLLKPEGMSSAYAVGAVKWKLKKPCGHMGTLDPMASGVLPVGVGHASRLFQYMLDKVKVYRAVFRFGLLTDTLDTTGKTESTTDVIPTENEILSVLDEFKGEILQVPPKYSAKCIDGKRGYQLARSGVEFSLEAKKVVILDYKLDKKLNDTDYEFTITCKGGTYIRSLARDLGLRLNSLCVMAELKRTDSGYFNLNNAVSVEEFKSSDDPYKYMIPADKVIDFPSITLNSTQAKRLIDGLYDEYEFDDGLYKVYAETEFWGVGEIKEKILKMKSYCR